MKTRNKITYLLGLVLLLAVSSCKDDFLEEKRDLSGTNEEVFKDPLLAQAYVDYIYGLFSPANNGTPWVQTQTASENGSYSSVFTQTTEELAGETDYNKTWATISNTQNHANKYFGQRMGTGIANNTWTRMKQINIFLNEIDKYGIEESTRNVLKGQMYFWRAWQYFELFRLYGGVPLILIPQNPIIKDGDDSNAVPRSKSSETIDQIVADLDMAISLLPGKWANSNDWGRITSGAAAALKGRALLTWASPQFNRNDDVARWQRAYEANVQAKTILDQNGFGLYKVAPTANGEAWAKMFLTEVNNPEAVMIWGFNSGAIGGTETRNSGWEQATRSKEINGGGSISPTLEATEAFPMKDGKMIDDPTSAYTYSLQNFYKNRDPRFYKTFIYNGAKWPYNGNTNFKQWTYVWKKTSGAANYNATTETRGANSSGIYINKATNPSASNTNGNFSQSGTDYMEIRYAEVLLNLAECEVGTSKLADALTNIKLVRERAGVENLDGNYGLSTSAGDRNKMFAAVLNERRIEFAYEGKRFYDLRRWLLFDDTYGQCTRLGTEPLNGTRRHGLTISVETSASGGDYVGTTDPLLKTASQNAPLVDRDPATYPTGIANYDAYLDYLYANYFKVSVKDDLDPTNKTPNWTFKWYPEYYFFGINQNLLDVAPYLEQTQGWNSLNGMGTFDPLQ